MHFSIHSLLGLAAAVAVASPFDPVAPATHHALSLVGSRSIPDGASLLSTRSVKHEAGLVPRSVHEALQARVYKPLPGRVPRPTGINGFLRQYDTKIPKEQRDAEKNHRAAQKLTDKEAARFERQQKKTMSANDAQLGAKSGQLPAKTKQAIKERQKLQQAKQRFDDARQKETEVAKNVQPWPQPPSSTPLLSTRSIEYHTGLAPRSVHHDALQAKAYIPPLDRLPRQGGIKFWFRQHDRRIPIGQRADEKKHRAAQKWTDREMARVKQQQKKAWGAVDQTKQASEKAAKAEMEFEKVESAKARYRAARQNEREAAKMVKSWDEPSPKPSISTLPTQAL